MRATTYRQVLTHSTAPKSRLSRRKQRRRSELILSKAPLFRAGIVEGLTAIILSGGKASRMRGHDKAFLKIGEDRLIDLQLRSLKKNFKKIIIVTNSAQRYRNLKGVKLVYDIIPDIGPLGGIYSGLRASNSFYNFVVACDMPFINPRLIKYMLKVKDGFDAVVPCIKKRYETLFAIYSKNCILPIYDILHTDNFRITGLFDKVKLKVIGEQEIIKFGDPKILFMNINTQRKLRSTKERKVRWYARNDIYRDKV